MAKDQTWHLVLFGKKILSFGRSNAKLMLDTNVDASFADLAFAEEEAKTKLQQIIDFLKLLDESQRKAIGMPRGVLIVGAPSEDRILLAKIIAGESHVPFFSISASNFVDSFPGVAASQLHELFKQARKRIACVVFIDDIDSFFFAEHAEQGGTADDERKKIRDQLLSEIDDSGPEQKRIITIVGTSSPDQIDSSWLRRACFDHRFRIEGNQGDRTVTSYDAHSEGSS